MPARRRRPQTADGDYQAMKKTKPTKAPAPKARSTRKAAPRRKREFKPRDAESAQKALLEANTQSEMRRHFIEAVLSGVSAGVLSIDEDGSILLGLQVNVGSGDASRDLADALLAALDAEPGAPVALGRVTIDSPRLQDLVDPAVPLTVEVHDGFEFWVDGVDDAAADVRASLDRAKSYAHPTVRLTGLDAALRPSAPGVDVDVRVFGKPTTRVYRRMAVALALVRGGTTDQARAAAREAASRVKIGYR